MGEGWVGVVLVGWVLVGLSGEVQAKDDRPNIIVTLMDDISAKEFGIYGNKETQTPNLDRMARRGTYFANCWSTPLCQPTRAMIMTGQYAWVTKWWKQGSLLNPPPTTLADYGTFAQKARQAGYDTLIVGKWQINGFTKEHGFSDYCLWRFSDVQTLDEIEAQYNGTLYKSFTQVPDQRRYWEPPIVVNDQLLEVGKNDFSMLKFHNCIRDFIRRNKRQGRKFLIYYPETMAHPDLNYDTLKQDFAYVPVLKGGKVVGKRKGLNFKNMVEFTDIMMGKLQRLLQKEGLQKETVFLFTADNGSYRDGKGSTERDFGVRVPFIAYGPGRIRAGKYTLAPIGLNDVYATVLDFMNVPKPANRKNSVSFKDVLTKKRAPWPRQWVYSYLRSRSGTGKTEFLIRNRDYIYDGKKKLYDCSNCRDKSSCCRPMRKSSKKGRELVKKFKSILRQVKDRGTSGPRRFWNYTD